MFMLRVCAIFSIFALYFYFRYLRYLPLKRTYPLLILALLLSFQLYLFELPDFEIPDGIQVVSRGLLALLCIGGFVQMGLDIVKVLLRLFGIRMGRIAPIIFLPLLGCVTFYGLYHALKVPSVEHITIEYEELPKELKGLKIAVMADPHVGTFFRQDRLDASIELLMAEKPDLIAIVGDAADAPYENITEDVLSFAKLNAPLGVYFVSGNHEYITGYRDWDRFFRSLDNLTVLENAHHNIQLGDVTLNIVGLTDPAGSRFGIDNGPSIKEALEGFDPSGKEYFRILLSHRPGIKENFKAQADLQLSGHTHGGAFYPVNFIIADSNAGYVKGLYEKDYGKIFVGSGLGLWDGLPLRLGTTSQIEILTLQ